MPSHTLTHTLNVIIGKILKSSTSLTIMSSFVASDPHKIYKNSFHWRNESGELDVFEAARYFNDQGAVPACIREDRHRPARRSLDAPIMRPNPDYHHHMMIDQKQLIKDQNKTKFKQPSSPGGRIASFLNSLFNQTSLKKKKKSKAGKDFEEESPGGRRKRRSSISHFRITSTTKNINAAAAADKLGSGFRTPPPYADTPTKSYKEFMRHHAVSLPVRNSEEKKPTIRVRDEKMLKDVGNLEKKGLRKVSDEDDGAESDSSSDLFDLDFFSSGLPVYETTHMARIKIAKQISTAT